MNKRIVRLALVTAVVLAAGLLSSCRSLNVGSSSSQQKAVDVVVLFHGAAPEVVPLFRKGDKLKIRDSGSVIGVIDRIETTATLEPTPNAKGELVAAVVPGQIDVLLTVKGTPVAAPDAYRFSGERIYVNQDIKLITPLVSFQGTVVSIRETGQ